MTIDLKLITQLICKEKVKKVVRIGKDDIDKIVRKEMDKLELEVMYWYLARDISRLSVERNKFCKDEYLKRINNVQERIKDEFDSEPTEKYVIKKLKKLGVLK